MASMIAAASFSTAEYDVRWEKKSGNEKQYGYHLNLDQLLKYG